MRRRYGATAETWVMPEMDIFGQRDPYAETGGTGEGTLELTIGEPRRLSPLPPPPPPPPSALPTLSGTTLLGLGLLGLAAVMLFKPTRRAFAGRRRRSRR